MVCSMRLLRLFFRVMWHWHPLWFGSLIDSPAPFVIMQTPWLAQWSSVVVLNFSYRSEFDALFLCGCCVRLHVVGFIFEWSSCLSLSWLWWPTACFFVITVCLGNSLRGRVCLRVVVLFVVFMVVAFVFAWLGLSSRGRLIRRCRGCDICLRVVTESTGWMSELVA